jgi:hypothetical protein
MVKRGFIKAKKNAKENAERLVLQHPGRRAGTPA